jgi:hypothetical protein
MSFTKIEIRNKSAEYARKLIEHARAFEPEITADLQKIAAEIGAEMVGLEYRFKTVKSLTRKIVQKVSGNLRIFTEAGFSFDEAFEKTINLQAKTFNDALRYTMILPLESYVFGFKQALERLKRKDYNIPENKIWNAWKNVGTKYDKGYRGINATVISSQKQIFELQFHTAESFHLKMKMHEFYKETGLATIADERKKELIQKMVESAISVSIPKGVRKL